MLQTITSTETMPRIQAGMRLCTGAEFKRAVKDVAFAVDRFESRFTLNGVCFESTTLCVYLVATNQYHMSVAKLGIGEKGNPGFKGVLDPEDLKTFAKVLAPKDEIFWEAVTYKGKSGVQFLWGAGTFGRFIEAMPGEFPTWQNVAPNKEYTKAITVSKADLQGVVAETVGWLKQEKKADPAVTLVYRNGKLSLVQETEHTYHTAKYEFKRYYDYRSTDSIGAAGDEFLVCTVNPRFLLQWLKAINGKSVTMWFKSDYLGVQAIPVNVQRTVITCQCDDSSSRYYLNPISSPQQMTRIIDHLKS